MDEGQLLVKWLDANRMSAPDLARKINVAPPSVYNQFKLKKLSNSFFKKLETANINIFEYVNANAEVSTAKEESANTSNQDVEYWKNEAYKNAQEIIRLQEIINNMREKALQDLDYYTKKIIPKDYIPNSNNT